MSETQFKAWAAFEKSGVISEWKYTPRSLGASDVEIKISHCGICGSDVHQLDSGWGHSIYPIVPGHEIVGEVTAVGANVKDLEIGQRVGVGAQRGSCGDCSQCNNHLEQYCSKNVWTYNSKYPDGAIGYGGYAQHIRLDSKFVFAVPENLPSEGAAPLFCAGATVFSPLKHYNVRDGQRLGILGIGGLGHLGVKFGAALGCDVTAISSSKRKENEVKGLGADAFLCSTDKDAMKEAKGSLDVILATVSANINWSDYLDLLRPDGRLIMVGLPEESLVISPFSLVGKRISVGGSMIGSPQDIKDMLKLASEKNITAQTELYPIAKVNEAIQNFRDGKPHYRYVLEISH